MPPQQEILLMADIDLTESELVRNCERVAYHDGLFYSVYMYDCSNPQTLLSARRHDRR
jgi:hypothetical protein